MPLLDVTELLSDPDLSSCFCVKRRSDQVSASTGRSQVTVELFTDVQGFVISIDPTTEIRTEDSTMIPRTIECCTTFPLRGPGEGTQPDILVYDGLEYTITKVKNHRQWGAGWVKVEATSMHASDATEEVIHDD